MNTNSIVLKLSIPLALLIAVASGVALLSPNYYSRETLNWQAQSFGQDIVDLCLLLPALIVSSIGATRGSASALAIWGGTVMYLTYTTLLFCFDVRFTQMFLVYSWALGLSVASVIVFLRRSRIQVTSVPVKTHSVHRFIGWYFIIVAVLFYTLWLVEIVPAVVHNTVPKSVAEAGLPTNGVHVLDLSVVLPTIFIVGMGLLRANTWSLALAPAILCFFVAMDLTIGVLVLIMTMHGLEGSNVVAIVMLCLACVSAGLFVRFNHIANTHAVAN